MFDSLDDSKVKSVHLKITALSSGGFFLDGYDITVVAVAILLLTKEFSLSPADNILVIGSTVIGMIFGGILGGYLTDKRGRKYIYLWDMVLFIIFTILTAVSTSVTELVLFRLLLGVAIGADYAISPTIIAEYAPKKHRGKLLTIAGLSWFVGAAFSYAGGYLLGFLGTEAWRYMFLIGVIPAAIVLVLRTSIPESPRWLLEKGEKEKAAESVREITGSAELELTESTEKASIGDLFRKKYVRATVFMLTFWFLLDAVTYVIALEGPSILESLGLNTQNASGVAAIVAVIAIIGAVLTFFLVDRTGRKKVTAIGFAGMAFTLVAAYFILVYAQSIAIFVALFILFEISQEFGPGITNSIYPQELFPTSIRATAQGLGTTVSRVGALVGIALFSIISDIFGFGAGMLLLAVMSFLGLAVTVVLGVETKGKSLEELTD